MEYSDFSIGKLKAAFGLNIQEDVHFFTDIQPIQPSPKLQADLEEGLPWAIAVGTEKARSEAVIYPVLLEVRRILDRQVSLFSGERFEVDAKTGLTGVCDFLLSQSPEQLEIEAPVVVLAEAKKGELKLGLAQCIAEMVAARQFNQQHGKVIQTIYGIVTSGTQWQFLSLQENMVSIDLTEYSINSVDWLLGAICWLTKHRA